MDRTNFGIKQITKINQLRHAARFLSLEEISKELEVSKQVLERILALPVDGKKVVTKLFDKTISEEDFQKEEQRLIELQKIGDKSTEKHKRVAQEKKEFERSVKQKYKNKFKNGSYKEPKEFVIPVEDDKSLQERDDLLIGYKPPEYNWEESVYAKDYSDEEEDQK